MKEKQAKGSKSQEKKKDKTKNDKNNNNNQTEEEVANKKKAPKTKEEFEAKLSDQIILQAREIRYDIIKNIAKKQFGWRCTRFKPDKETGSQALTHAKADWDVAWIDADFCIDKLRGMKPYQKINHFPGMTIISLKNNLAKYLKLLQKQMPSEFNFFPKTWIFPYESYELVNFMEGKKTMTFIVKPVNSS